MTACEVNAKRRRKLQENLARVGLDVPVVESFGATEQSDDRTTERFPKILVDAPCSNTGVLRRRPDARWNWSAEKLAALVKLQAEILDQVAPLVAPGGTLVYSTFERAGGESAASRGVPVAASGFHVEGHEGVGAL